MAEQTAGSTGEPNLPACRALARKLAARQDPAHDFAHLLRVEQTTVRLVEAMQSCFVREDERRANHDKLMVARVAALFHEALTWNIQDERSKQVIRQEIKQCCKQDGMTAAHDCSAVVSIIENISFSKEVESGYPDSLPDWVQQLRDCVSDADKLDAIGNHGIERYKQFRFHDPGTPVDCSDDTLAEAAEQHCTDRLLRLWPEFIRTDTGKLLGKQLHRETQLWVDKRCKKRSKKSSSKDSKAEEAAAEK